MTATLMHAPRTCSLAVRFAAAEGRVPLAVEPLALRTKRFERGGSLFDVHPLGQVSVLRLPSGEILTETSAVLMWVQAQSPHPAFRRGPDDPDYYQMLRWIGFCATELHKQIFRIVFYPEATEPVKDRFRDLAPQRFALLDRHLANRPFLLGDGVSAADAYLAWVLALAPDAGLDTTPFPHLSAYRARVLARPAINALVQAEFPTAAR